MLSSTVLCCFAVAVNAGRWYTIADMNGHVWKGAIPDSKEVNILEELNPLKAFAPKSASDWESDIMQRIADGDSPYTFSTDDHAQQFYDHLRAVSEEKKSDFYQFKPLLLMTDNDGKRFVLKPVWKAEMHRIETISSIGNDHLVAGSYHTFPTGLLRESYFKQLRENAQKCLAKTEKLPQNMSETVDGILKEWDTQSGPALNWTPAYSLTPYLGESVAQLVKANIKITSDDFLSLCKQLRDALTILHKSGMAHCDLVNNDGNVIIQGTSGKLKLIVIDWDQLKQKDVAAKDILGDYNAFNHLAKIQRADSTTELPELSFPTIAGNLDLSLSVLDDCYNKWFEEVSKMLLESEAR